MRLAAAVLLVLVVATALAVLILGTPEKTDRPFSVEESSSKPAAEPDVVSAGAPDEAPAPAGRLRGRVIGAGGEAVDGAFVTARALAEDGWPGPFAGAPVAVSDGLGRFSLPGLEPGRYALEVRDDRGWGYLPAVAVHPEGSRDVEVRLLPEATIAGTVVTESGHPISGAVVTTDLSGFLRFLHGRTGRPAGSETAGFSARTDESGRFRLTGLPVGRYDLRVEAPGHGGRTVPGVVAPVSDVELVLWVGHVLPVSVTCSRGGSPRWIRIETAPPDASVELVPERGRAEGLLTGLPEGRLRVTARAEGHLPASEEVEIVAGRRTGLELRLEPAEDVTGRLLRSGGRRGVAGAEIEFRVATGPTFGERCEPEARAVTNDRGWFRARIGPGNWEVTIRVDGRTENHVLALGEDPDDLELTWHPFPGLAGSVRYEDGAPVPDARVVASELPVLALERSSVPKTASTTTGPGGEFRIESLLTGTRYEVTATGPAGLGARLEDVEASSTGLRLVLESPGRGGARGRVIDEREDAVVDALVLLPGAVTGTDADGRFVIRDVPAGRRTGWILAAGHPPVPVTVDFRADEVAELGEILLPWRDPMIWGAVLDGEGRAFAGARVRLTGPGSDRVVAEALSRSDGAFGIAWPLPRETEARLVVSAPGRALVTREGNFDALSRTDDFVLRRSGGIRGEVRTSLSGVVVTLWHRDRREPVLGPVHWGPRGRFVVRHVPPGDVVVEIRAEGCEPLRLDPVRVTEGAVTRLPPIRLRATKLKHR